METTFDLENEIDFINKYINDINKFKNEYNILEQDMTHTIPHLHKCIMLSKKKKFNKLLDYVENYIARFPYTINQVDTCGRSLLHCATLTLQSSISQYFTISQFLIDHNCNVNLQDTNGLTVLHYICYIFNDENKLKAVRLMIDSGAIVNTQNKHGFTPLHIVVMQINNLKIMDDKKTMNEKEIINTFIKAGANLNLQNKLGYSVYHILGQKYGVKFIVKIKNDLINKPISKL